MCDKRAVYFFLFWLKLLLIAPCSVSSNQLESSVTVAGEKQTDAVGYECLIEPWSLSKPGSEVLGIVSEVLVDKGSFVEKNQPIVQLNDTLERTRVEHAEARVANLGRLITRHAELSLAELEYQRTSELYENQQISQKQLDEARTRLQVSKSAHAQAIADRSALLMELKGLRQQLYFRTLRSPVDGVVTERFVQPGERVTTNPVMAVATLDPLRIDVVLPDTLFDRVKVGDRVSVATELDKTHRLKATVDVVDALLDSYSSTFTVRLRLPNPKLDIVAGQRCQAYFDVLTTND